MVIRRILARRADSREITEAEWAALLVRSAKREAYLGPERRVEERHDHGEIVRLGVELTWTGKTRKRYLVRTQDVSAEQGVGFLHSQPTQPGTRCRVAMLNQNKKLVQVTGKVASCTLRPDRVYAVGVKFDEPVAVGEIVARKMTSV